LSVDGTVTTHAGLPSASTTVTIDGGLWATSTDKNGHYSFADVLVGPHTLAVGNVDSPLLTSSLTTSAGQSTELDATLP
jgi:hypothetical protein